MDDYGAGRCVSDGLEIKEQRLPQNMFHNPARLVTLRLQPGTLAFRRPHRGGSQRSFPSLRRSLLASTDPHRRPALLALATALTPGFEWTPPAQPLGQARNQISNNEFYQHAGPVFRHACEREKAVHGIFDEERQPVHGGNLMRGILTGEPRGVQTPSLPCWARTRGSPSHSALAVWSLKAGRSNTSGGRRPRQPRRLWRSEDRERQLCGNVATPQPGTLGEGQVGLTPTITLTLTLP